GKSFGTLKAGRRMEQLPEEMKAQLSQEVKEGTKPDLRWNRSLTKNKAIIKDLTDRHIFAVSPDLQRDCEQLLKYDFDANSTTAHQSVTRLAEHIFKSPEFQIY
ncbi:MAG: hypothetical protein KKG00_08265, partial [Bacteroidetes bacterium]|nr:hypothetical protein [Bacteroidota bacterium]